MAEDYDTFIENLLTRIRELRPIQVQEPTLSNNTILGTIFGAGNLSQLGNPYYAQHGELQGSYGEASLPRVPDYYSIYDLPNPYRLTLSPPPLVPITPQRGFYNQEFPPIRLNNDADNQQNDQFRRDTDSPDSVVSSSSVSGESDDSTSTWYPELRRLCKEDGRVSPVLPLFAPIPVRPDPVSEQPGDTDKENSGCPEVPQQKSRLSSGIPLRESGNVSVTLTLSAAAAENVSGVLRDLANLLDIPTPTGYQVSEQTSTPPSQKLGLYQTKGKDGKDGATIDIQSILNGEAKFCKHCDVVILNNIKIKASELPFLAKEDVPDGEDFLYFCSSSCYMQFALVHRSSCSSQDKAAAIVDHLCQNEVPEKISSKTLEGEKTEEGKEKTVPSKEPSKDIVQAVTSEPKAPVPESLNKRQADAEPIVDKDLVELGTKKWKGIGYKTWSPGALQPVNRYKESTPKEITEMLFTAGTTVAPYIRPEDTRSCIFCHQVGDGVTDGPGRLLNYDVDKWVHLNCALWSDNVYETVNGALMNLDSALQLSLVTSCVACQRSGATILCFKPRCSNVYHLNCALKAECLFFKNKTVFCASHASRNDKEDELTTLAVYRRVYVDRDEDGQVATMMRHSVTDENQLRVGSLIFQCVGQLLPHQLEAFHTSNLIYPIGYNMMRYYWSMRVRNKRCCYTCSIHDVAGKPEFRVLVEERNHDDLELRGPTPKAVWAQILEPMSKMSRENGGIKVFPRYVSGDDLFGLTEPTVVRILESLPGVETLTDYRFKYGRNPLLELPPAVNPTGCARTEPKLRTALPWKRPHTQRTSSSPRPLHVPIATVVGEAACPTSKQFIRTKSSQYKKMKQEWRNNVYLARSKIQGLGLYAARDLERHTMVIEYIGAVIRTELSEMREKLYEDRNRGIYMFRLDEERVVDATLSGGLARYINHSCNPNCVAEIVDVDRDLRIIIFAKRRISRGEELAYDYKFDIEDDKHKIPCHCGGSNCRKWMN